MALITAKNEKLLKPLEKFDTLASNLGLKYEPNQNLNLNKRR